jgi:pimeloyl-ACP methyl ester carboxylesterase
MMNIVDVGSGVPIVIVPGIQGRWEWMRPAVDALAAHCRVVTFSLADEPSCGGSFDPATGFTCYVDQIREALAQARVDNACICGVSYGGLIAAAFAARYPDLAKGLILVSAIPPAWQPDYRARFYIRAPRLLMPLFMLASLRMYREIAAATPGRLGGVHAAARHGLNVLTHMFSPSRMARRVQLLQSMDGHLGLETVSVPTLVITGEARLDRVVPVRLTEDYLRIWPHAERATIGRTGHLGLITRPQDFASIVARFVERHQDGESAGSAGQGARRVG